MPWVWEGLAINYYEHHLGDYAKDTAHLSMIEHGAYRILLDAYYTREVPLPTDRRACYKLARAQSKDERAAVDYVLQEFFFEQVDGFHNERCDSEIAGYYAKKPAAEEKRENAKERQRKARERRKAIFEELSRHGIHMPWNATTEQAQAELSRIKSQPVTEPVTQPVTRDNTATSRQSPDTSLQNPTTQSVSCTQPELREQPVARTRKGEICGLLRKAGMADAAPHYLPDDVWEQILGKRTNEEIVEVARAKMAARPGQRTGLKYIARALLEDPAPVAINGQAQPRMTQHQRNQAAIAESLFGPQSRGPIQAPAEKLIEGEVIYERA